MNRLKKEFGVFLACPRPMRILLITNIIYALVLPVIEIFVAAYVMRNSHDVRKVVTYQLAIYAGTPLAFLMNGFMLGRIGVQRLYSAGMLLSAIAMLVMMSSNVITPWGIAISGMLMGTASGLFWANRGFLALSTTTDDQRNYFYGVETFFLTITSVLVPAVIGWFIEATAKYGWVGGDRNNSYRIVAVCALVLTIVASIVINTGVYENPPRTRFVYFHFDSLWHKMLALATLKGLAQGYLVTAPAMLIMMLVGQEGTLGLVQAAGGIVSSFLLYAVGRSAKPEHRVRVFAIGLVLFAVGSTINAIMFDAKGVLIFMACLVLAKPLLDLAYFPIQMLIIDTVSALELRNQYAYIFNHEIGLFFGRLMGCGLFIVLATYVSRIAALKYALPTIAVLQMASIWVARNTLSSAAKAGARMKLHPEIVEVVTSYE
jgi:MFS transporter, YQGE family, putative transporter